MTTEALPDARAWPRATHLLGGVEAMLFLVMAVALQIAAPLHLFGSELRVEAADILVGPQLAVVILLRWRVLLAAQAWRIAGIWLAAMTAVIVLGVTIGHTRIGAFFLWAVVNKGAGWFVLLCYFFAGLGLGLGSDETRRAFLRTLIVFAWLAAAAAILVRAYLRLRYPALDTSLGFDLVTTAIAEARTGYGFDLVFGQYFSLTGSFANPNAFGLLTATVLLLQLGLGGPSLGLARRLRVAGLGVLLLALYLSGSLSAWLGFAAGLSALAALRRIHWRLLVQGVAIALTAALLPHAFEIVFEPAIEQSVRELPAVVAAISGPPKQNYSPYWSSMAHHFDLARQALTLWLDHPLWGSGIGVFYWLQQQSGTPFPQTIHPTLLWMLAELGIAGTSVFIAFYLRAAVALYREATTGPHAAIAAVIFAAIMMAGAASAGMEITYQRHLWLVLGLGLAASSMGRAPWRAGHVEAAAQTRNSAA